MFTHSWTLTYELYKKIKKNQEKITGLLRPYGRQYTVLWACYRRFGVLLFVTLGTVQFSRDKGFLAYLVDRCGRNKLLISTSYPQLISIGLFISASKMTDQLITSNNDNSHQKHKYSNLHYIEIKSRLTCQNNQKTIIL